LVRVSLVQLRAFDLNEAAEGLRHTLEMVDRAAAERPDLIVLPEVTYPAYFLRSREEYRQVGPLDAEGLVRTFGGKAAQHGVYLAVGAAFPSDEGEVTNSALLFAPDGSLAGRYDKSFLWHFDRRWYRGGAHYPVFETPLGRLGLLICADGRLPEIARCLALGGAQVIVDSTAWVSWGRQPSDLSNPQPEYMMSARALENGVWVVAAGKVGIETGSILYCGRSCVIDPRGRTLASAGTEEETVLTFDLDPAEATGPPFARRPDLYSALTAPTEELPAARLPDEPLAVGPGSRRLAVLQATLPPTGAALLDHARRWVETLRRQDTDLFLFPATPIQHLATYLASDLLSPLQALSGQSGVMLGVTLLERAAGARYRTFYLLDGGEVLLAHRQSHHDSDTSSANPPAGRAGLALGDEPCPVASTRVGNVGVLLCDEGFVPEVARSLMLRGAEVLLWPADAPRFDVWAVARSRADENRVYMAVATAPTAEGGACVVDPTGRVVASALAGREMACSAQVNRALSRWKDMAPATNVVLGRRPETYGMLLSE
jgi:predicted amidohydrolase